jgi:hypothetical protein
VAVQRVEEVEEAWLEMLVLLAVSLVHMHVEAAVELAWVPCSRKLIR